METLTLLGIPRTTLPLSYYAYRRGDYVPDESRPILRVRGKRRWYAPWSREPDKQLLGMSEAMAFRLQDAMLS